MKLFILLVGFVTIVPFLTAAPNEGENGNCQVLVNYRTLSRNVTMSFEENLSEII